MFSGSASEEGGVIISPDTCVIFNSFDQGYGFAIFDKDRGGDLTTDTSRVFSIDQGNYFAWSRGGFCKEGSSNDYVLLGGGGHTLLSSLTGGGGGGVAEALNTNTTYIDHRINGTSSDLPRLTWHISNVNWCNLSMDTSGNMHLRSGNTPSGSYSSSFYGYQFYASSDIRRKTNIESIASLVPIKKFNWKHDGSLSYGFIAQELIELGHKELVGGSEDNLTVNYDAALSLGMAKLSNYVEKLENTVRELQEEIRILKNK
jgi:hypothetical protein